MDDLISRSALLAAYDKAHQGPPGGARKLIEDAPDAIVRCKDCTEYQEWGGGKISMRLGSYYGDVPPNWFCAYGKRRIR